MMQQVIRRVWLISGGSESVYLASAGGAGA